MVWAGDIKMVRYGKYIPVDSVDSVDSSYFREDKKKNHPLFDGREDGTESTESTPVPASAPEEDAEAILAALPNVPPVAPPTLAAPSPPNINLAYLASPVLRTR
jgi:hypothetical protein